jgi:hypothetical protein
MGWIRGATTRLNTVQRFVQRSSAPAPQRVGLGEFWLGRCPVPVVNNAAEMRRPDACISGVGPMSLRTLDLDTGRAPPTTIRVVCHRLRQSESSPIRTAPTTWWIPVLGALRAPAVALMGRRTDSCPRPADAAVSDLGAGTGRCGTGPAVRAKRPMPLPVPGLAAPVDTGAVIAHRALTPMDGGTMTMRAQQIG